MSLGIIGLLELQSLVGSCPYCCLKLEDLWGFCFSFSIHFKLTKFPFSFSLLIYILFTTPGFILGLFFNKKVSFLPVIFKSGGTGIFGPI
jgi:hypothetical protein